MNDFHHNKSPKMLALLYTFLLLLTPERSSFFARIFKIPQPLPLLIDNNSNK